MSLATIEDFEQRHGTLDVEERARVQGFLDDATELILEVGDDTWDEATAPQRVRGICRWVAYRAWSNPDALSQSSMGDVALSYTRDGVPDAVFLTKSEHTSIVRAAEGSTFVSATLVTPYSGTGDEDFLLGE